MASGELRSSRLARGEQEEGFGVSSLLQSLVGGQPPQSLLTRCFSGLHICLGMRVGSLQGRWQKSFGGLSLKSHGPTARSLLHSPPPPPPGALLPPPGSPWPCGCLCTSVLLSGSSRIPHPVPSSFSRSCAVVRATCPGQRPLGWTLAPLS